ncbi:BZ3500_MvSof-1268-A1-R1_Chr4-2g07146 [Microbotryum saponariae]|uniref:BZ3500_MvSof-1268-A1-R1_Chr4-2g07146 protein n=1 Tax=Microbotryum saponariae TaxID=289078 RepID=A0A2X0LIE6_9BASI|nr:BZ3500_MvSof-1268-A1-R1_Chr4-2g07146 [Microbotryum saponariae]SDA06811.1 BZ3501_MvSof-1269-A2-R1_Chr4-2g06857 [Microbotryum saponariae]
MQIAVTGQTLTTRDLVEKVPLIKSPSFWVPKPVELPPDIHPLPDSVEPYVRERAIRATSTDHPTDSEPHVLPSSTTVPHQQFVYPFTIENHALSVLPAALEALRSSHGQRLERLRSYSEAKEKARKAHLNAVAPGWTGDGGMILPSKKETFPSQTMTSAATGGTTSSLSTEFVGLSVNEDTGTLAAPSPSDPMRDFVEGLDSLESKRLTTATSAAP